jgi:hypothetical protein
MPRPAATARSSAARTRQRLLASVSRDPHTGLIRRGRVERRAFEVVIRMPKRLESPNRWLWTSWMVKKRAVDAWAQAIRQAALDSSSVDWVALATAAVSPAASVGWLAPPVRVRVTVERLVPSTRHLIKDSVHNLAFASKGVVDCVVKAGFLRDDSDRHIDLVCTQAVSPDGLDWTVITITAPSATEHYTA